MKLKQLSEVVWKFYEEGRNKTSAQTFSKRDIQQYVTMGIGSKYYVRWYQAKKMDGGQKDYYFYSADLSLKKVPLGEANNHGIRRAEYSKFDFIKLPHNEDITNVYPLGGKCSEKINEITQVAPGEENFYTGPEFSSFWFFVEKGEGINLYNIPPCVCEIEIERVWVTENMDVSLDMAYDIANEVLGIVFKEKAFPIKTIDNPYNPKPIELRRKLEEQQSDV